MRNGAGPRRKRRRMHALLGAFLGTSLAAVLGVEGQVTDLIAHPIQTTSGGKLPSDRTHGTREAAAWADRSSRSWVVERRLSAFGCRAPDERLGHLVLRACFVEKPENIDESPLGEIPLVDKSALSINNSR